MNETTNEQVTISAAYFAELWQIANEADKVCEDCVREKCGECKVVKERDELRRQFEMKEEQCNGCAALRAKNLMCEELEKERDELKAMLDIDATVNGLSPATQKLLETECKLAKAERCIEDVYDVLKESVITDCGDGLQVYDIIRDYREQKEAK